MFTVEDRKLFIGMISKNLNEEEVRLMFTPFGTVEDCTVLRDANSLSRGDVLLSLCCVNVFSDLLSCIVHLMSVCVRAPIDIF